MDFVSEGQAKIDSFPKKKKHKEKSARSEKDLANGVQKKGDTKGRPNQPSDQHENQHDIRRENEEEGIEKSCQTDIEMEQMSKILSLMENQQRTSLDKNTQFYKLCCILMNPCAKTIRKLINHCLPHIKFNLRKLLKIYQPNSAYTSLDDLDLTQLCRLFSDVQRAAIQHHVNDISSNLHDFLKAKKGDILRTLNDKKAENSLFPQKGSTDIKRWTPSQLIFVYRFVLKEKFLDKIQEDGHQNLREFLLTKKDAIISVDICKSSESILYPELKDTNLETWSSHLICCMLTEVFGVDVVLHPVLYEHMMKLCNLRNTIFHCTDQKIDADQYGKYMQTITTHNQFALKYIKDDSLNEEIEREIANIDKGHILPLESVFGLIRRLELTDDRFQSIATTLKENGESHQKTHEYLSENKRVQHIHTHQLTEALQLLRSTLSSGQDSQQEVTLTIQQKNISSRQEKEASAILVDSFEKTNPSLGACSSEIDKTVFSVKEKFEEDNQRIVKANPGCVRLTVQCKDLSSLVTLLEKYMDGQLTAIFKPIEDQIKRMEGFEQYKHEVVIDAKDLSTTLTCIARDIANKEENDLQLSPERNAQELPSNKGGDVQLNQGTKLKGIAIKEVSSFQLSPGNKAIQNLKESCMEECGMKMELGDSFHETSTTDSSQHSLKQVTGVIARGVGKVTTFLDDKSADGGPKKRLKRKLKKINAPKEHGDKMEMRNTLKNIEHKTKGKPSKRMRVLNSYDERFRADFKLVMSKGIPEAFIPPEEVEEVKERLKNNHIVVVTGYGDSSYLQVAMFAIRELQYEERFCALLTDPSNWVHVDPEETKLVVFKDPFGSLAYDQNSSISMFSKLDDIEFAVGDDSGLDVVIVSKQEFVNEAMRSLGKAHDLLQDRVIVYKQVGEQTPFSMAGKCLI